ncbi:cyclophilin-like fold protein [Providencia rettgeri]|uniref:cyclophilin-like fold protein n=1 Tax=Providencia TaxID=586 RepID=UPI0021D48E1C|nr:MULTISPECIES: cyclophilin-like fold protein [Providencia]WIE08366.1 cyclophilin-like fold protein [Providencia rettgeri]
MLNLLFKNRLTPLNFYFLLVFACISQPLLARSLPIEPKVYLIEIRLDTQIIKAELKDSEMTRDFISLLPLTVELADYSSTEKITYLPRKLLTRNSSNGIVPEIGDITYYAPWGNIAIFYQPFSYSSGLFKLGKITDGLEYLQFTSPKQAVIELIQRNN